MDNNQADVSPDPVPSAPPAPPAPAEESVSRFIPAMPVMPAMPSLDDVKEKVANLNGRSSAVTSLMIGAAIAFFVAFILYWTITHTTTPIPQFTYVVPSTKVPQPGYDVNTFTTEGMPTVKDKATVSFWLYVNEFADVPTLTNGNPNTVYRHVWHRGEMKWSKGPESTCPMVLFQSSRSRTDPQKNSLLVIFRTSDITNPYDGNAFASSSSPPTTTATPPSLTTKINYMLASRGISIDYLPVKRWVHVAVTVNTKGKTMKAYVDGELVKTIDNRAGTTVAGFFKAGTPATGNTTAVNASSVSKRVGRQFAKMDLNGTGDISVGGRPTSDLGAGFSGLVSNIRFSNWNMSSTEIYQEYKKGPVDNVMSRMGLPAYGLQAPIYKISQE